MSIVFTGVPPVVPLAKAGKVRLLATTAKQRMTYLPDVPTISEAGVQGADVLIWYGLIAPAATPKDVIARLNREIVKVMSLPDVRDKFLQLGVDPASSSAEEFAQMIRDEVARWGKVIRGAGIKLSSHIQPRRQRDADRSPLLRSAVDREDGPDQLCLLTQTREAVMPRRRSLHVETDAIVGDSQC